MKKMIFKWMVFSVLAGSTAFLGGCRTRNSGSADLYGSDNLYGDPMLGDVALAGDNLGLPMDGDRSLFEPLYFAYDSSQVNDEEAGKCEQVAQHIKKGKGQGVIIEGHTDERGSREYNLALGERRSLAVRDYLINLGVDPSVIQTKSFGEELPESMAHDDVARRKNRRAVFAIY